MGCCASINELDIKNIQDLDETPASGKSDKKFKILLLGNYRSGKTVLFTQLQYIHGDGFDNETRKKFRDRIYQQLVDELQSMISVLTDNSDEPEYDVFIDEIERDQTKIDPGLQNSVDYIFEISRRSNVTIRDELAQHIERLWNDEAIQLVFDRRAKAGICDSTQHFMNNVRRICDKNYIPTHEDVLLVEYRTMGLIEKVFKIGPECDTFKFVDVGGVPIGL